MINTEDNHTAPASPPPPKAAAVRSSSPGAHVLSEFERLLTQPGCPSCRHVAETERSFFSWFEIESHTTSEMQAQLRAAMGMCPPHERRLLERPGEGHVMTIVMREALAGARLAMRGEAQTGPCPACDSANFAARHARRLLFDGLRDPAIARLYAEHQGICLVHLLDALPETDRGALKVLAERLLGSLYEGSGFALVELLAGADADAPRRAMWQERLPRLSSTGSTVERLSERMEIDACPVCLAVGVTERDYLHWFLARSTDNDTSLDTEPGELCPTHLHDLALADPPVAFKQGVARKRTARIAQLERLLARLAQTPAPERRRRRTVPDGLDVVRGEMLARPHCSACHVRDGVERAQQDLVALSLGLAATRDQYERGHGLCARHARQVPDGPTARAARHHADARLALIAWEVQETARKYAWAFRHEASGPERDGWLRGMGQIDGRVFEGGPAPIGEHDTPLMADEMRESNGDGNH